MRWCRFIPHLYESISPMSPSSQAFLIEPMRLEDIPAVILLEQAAYGSHWYKKDYSYELERNRWAYYFVLRAPQVANRMVGQAGFWLVADQIHINTIVVLPQWRGLGLGHRLLITLLEQGQTLGAREATLEVRVSNRTALALYDQYQFKQVGYRKRYYSDNGEDALLLTTPAFTSPHFQTMLRRRKATLQQRLPQIIDKIAGLD